LRKKTAPSKPANVQKEGGEEEVELEQMEGGDRSDGLDAISKMIQRAKEKQAPKI